MLKLKDASVEDVETRLKELKSDFVELSEGRREDVTDDGLRDMIREVDTLDTFLTLSAAVERREQAKIAATAGALAADAGVRSIGEAFATPEMVEFVIKGHRGGVRSDGFEIDYTGDDGKKLSRWLRAAGMRAVTEWGSSGPPGFDPTDSGGLLPQLGQPIPPVPRQAKLYLRDLIPTMTTTLAQLPYVRELNPTSDETATGNQGAQAVAEGGTKPAADLTFASESSPMSTIASTLTLSKQMFEDAPAVVQYINMRLPYLVKFREDNEFLAGSGTWPNMTGLLNTAGILSQSATSGEYAITIGAAFAKVENQDGSPTAVVMNPTDAWAMFTKRASGGSGTFDAGTPFSSLPLTVWGVPTYRTRAKPSGSALVSDFERGAMVADRETVNTQTYRERYAEQNLILLVCEERCGLMVFRPDLFCNTTLA
jgi:HK97 family phage major capsid protein